MRSQQEGMRLRILSVSCLVIAFASLVAGGTEGRVNGPVIGIDLGTTFSCVSVLKAGQVEVIPNDQGNRITPSIVAFAADERLVGEAAKNHAALHPTEALFDVKRLLGRRFSDTAVQKDLKMLPFQVVDKGDKPGFVIPRDGTDQVFEPEQISALLLGKLKAMAEQYLDSEVKHAVITVPASFNNAQRQATKDAAAIAGLEVLRLLNEPTAAAVAYGLDKLDARTVLVYDLGGGTFDVTVLRVDSGVLEVKATGGDARLGGADFDNNVVQHLAKAFEKKHSRSILSDKIAVQKLRREAEKVKRTLSNVPKANFAIDDLHEGTGFSGTLTRARFEEVNHDLFKRTVEIVKQVLKDAGIAKDQVDDLVLVGGSSRIPKLQQLVREFFDGKDLARGINPDEAVAHGAAIQAGSFSATESGATEALLLDVAPLSVGLQTVGGIMTPVISRNTPIPCRNSIISTTHRDNQPALDIRVFEGERSLTKNNHFLGKFRLKGLSPSPRGQTQVAVIFDIDADGILTVTAENSAAGTNESLSITRDQNGLSPSQIETMLREAEEMAEEDAAHLEGARASAALDSYLLTINAFLESEAGGDEENAELKRALLDGKDFLAANPDAQFEEIKEKQEELEGICGSILAQHGGGGGGSAPTTAGSEGVTDDDMEGHDEL